MTKITKQKFRVEANHGCKYFNDLKSALRYFNKFKTRRVYVELWEIVIEETPALYSVTQILLDCMGGDHECE